MSTKREPQRHRDSKFTSLLQCTGGKTEAKEREEEVEKLKNRPGIPHTLQAPPSRGQAERGGSRGVGWTG